MDYGALPYCPIVTETSGAPYDQDEFFSATPFS